MPEEAKKLILVVDDEPRMIQFIRMNLELEGYRVTQASNGLEALNKIRDELPDLVVLDVMMPEMDGFETLRMLREVSSVPVIMLTVKADEDDKVKGLELGADDYVTKPFSPRELVARVRAVLRRAGPEREVAVLPIVADDVAIDPQRRAVTVAGRAVELTPTEFDLLVILASHPGRVFSRMELLDRVQGYAFEGYERTVDAHVKNLRQKIEPDPRQPRYLLTVFGVGYKFVEP